MFFITVEDHAASLGFRSGHIVSAHYRVRRGERALSELITRGIKSFRFDSSADVKADNPALPPTPQLATMLGIDDLGAKPTLEVKSSKSQSKAYSAYVQQSLEDLLVDYVGPMAVVLVQDVLSKKDDLGSAITTLSQEISNSVGQEAFLERARQKLL